MKKLLSVFCCLALTALCFTAVFGEAETTETTSPEGQVADSQPVAVPDTHVLGPEDVIRITVLGEPELTSEQVIDPSGLINVPLVGQMEVGRLTGEEARMKITLALSKYLVDPKVQLTFARIRNPKVYVLGSVQRPGLHEFRLGERIMEAIAQGGSFREDGDLRNATLTRKGSDESIPLNLHKLFFEGDMSHNILLEDGDTIYIPEDITNKFYVLGEVMRPGSYKLKDNLNVVDAVSIAGGPRERASLQDTFIIRGDPRNAERIKIDLNKLVKTGDVGQNMLLKPGDVIFVAETSKPNWRDIASILSAVVNTTYVFRMWGM